VPEVFRCLASRHSFRRTVAINGSRPAGNHHSPTMPASPFASRGSERPIQMERLSTPPPEMLPEQRGRMPTRIARRSGTRGRLTRAMTDSHRAALLTRHASSDSTPLQPLAAPQSRLAIRPSPPNPGPSPSLSQSRGELRSPDCGREGVGFARGGRERAELVFLWFPIAPLAVVIALLTVGGASDASQTWGRG
jgi:hypothetical protein